MARFQNWVMLFKIAARFPDIWALEDILEPVSYQTKSKTTPFMARPEPISNTVYNKNVTLILPFTRIKWLVFKIV